MNRIWQGVLLAVLIHQTCAAQNAPMTLNEALARAEAVHPSLRIARADVDAARAEANDAKAWVWNNPQVGVELRQRRLGQVSEPAVSRRDAALGISQTFETGGQPAARRHATQATLGAAQASVEGARRELRAQITEKFYRTLMLQARVRTEEQAQELLERAAAVVAKRFKAGEDSRLDGNLALVEAERSAHQLAQIRSQLTQASLALAAALQLPPGIAPEVVGETDVRPTPYGENDLLAAAARHPRLLAATASEQAAQSRLAMERGARSPDLTVGLNYSPERGVDTKDRVTTLSISVPLPLFRNNEGAIGRAAGEAERSRVERESLARALDGTVRSLWRQQQDLVQRVERLRQTMLPSVVENQQLSLKALQAGEIGLGQYLLVRRQVLDAQRDLLDATAELLQTRTELEAAAGWPEVLPTPPARSTP